MNPTEDFCLLNRISIHLLGLLHSTNLVSLILLGNHMEILQVMQCSSELSGINSSCLNYHSRRLGRVSNAAKRVWKFAHQ